MEVEEERPNDKKNDEGDDETDLSEDQREFQLQLLHESRHDEEAELSGATSEIHGPKSLDDVEDSQEVRVAKWHRMLATELAAPEKGIFFLSSSAASSGVEDQREFQLQPLHESRHDDPDEEWDNIFSRHEK